MTGTITASMRTTRLAHACASLASVGLGAILAAHYPLSASAMLVAFALASAVAYLRPSLWLFVVPAALPGIGFASWTGWIAFEELDILIMAAAAGGYAALAFAPDADGSRAAGGVHALQRGLPSFRMPTYARVLIGLFALSLSVALARGVAGAATQHFGFFDGYDDAINSVRIAKPFFLALWLMPLLRAELARAPSHALNRLASGLAVGLGIASLAVIWERVAFTGLLNFSSDYRATAMFWEMHVGGAALDGFLAMTAPFAVWQVLRYARPLQWATACAIALAGTYTCLATFSRAVYLALPASMGLLTLLQLMQRQSLSLAVTTIVRGGALAGTTAVAAYLVFRGGGYRALLAVLAVFCLTMLLGAPMRRLNGREWLVAVTLGCVAGFACVPLAKWIPKGNYLVFAAAFAACAGLGVRSLHKVDARTATAALAAYFFAVVAAGSVAWGWGGEKALWGSAFILAVLVASAFWNWKAATAVWPGGPRAQVAIAGAAAGVAFTVAVFSGGAYMNDRFDSVASDLGKRARHWRDGIGLLATPSDWLLGKGLGRYPQSYYFGSREGAIPGAYRIGTRDGNKVMTLFGPRRDGGFMELFRISQRVHPIAQGQYSVVLDVLAVEDVLLHIEVCEQHLLYSEGCAIGSIDVRATPDVVQRKVVSLDGKNLMGGPWYAPRLGFFSMSVESPGRRIEIDHASVYGPHGQDLLANGNFSQGMSRWFEISEAMHLPWHIENVGLDVLFDQGIAGLVCFGLLVGAALVRLMVGHARRHPAAPFLAAALAGFLVVGALDSLLDVPRDAFVFYLLVMLGFTLPDAQHDRAQIATTNLSAQGFAERKWRHFLAVGVTRTVYAAFDARRVRDIWDHSDQRSVGNGHSAGNVAPTARPRVILPLSRGRMR